MIISIYLLKTFIVGTRNTVSARQLLRALIRKMFTEYMCLVYFEKVQVGKDQEKAQSEKDLHSKNRGGKKTKPTIRYLYHENIS